MSPSVNPVSTNAPIDVPEYSIIIPCHNGLEYTTQAVASIFKHTRNFELILSLNKCSDGTLGWALDISKRYPNVKVFNNQQNFGFAAACNIGLEYCTGRFIILLNNDVIVTPGWADQLATAIQAAEITSGLAPFGYAGPASNYVGGRQAVSNARYDLAELDSFATEFHKSNQGNLVMSGWISGFCFMMTRAMFEDVGTLDEKFGMGGYEDNDYCLRAYLKGWKGVIAGDTFVHHFGSRTISKPEFAHLDRGTANFNIFFDKWADWQRTHSKIFAVFRVKNEAAHSYYKEALLKAAQCCDAVIVLCDNCTDNSAEIARSISGVVHVEESTEPFNERRDRNFLYAKARELGANWVFSLDADEVLEDKVTYATLHRLVSGPNPEVSCLGFSYYTFFKGTDNWRADGIFGKMRGFRLVRAIPNTKIVLGSEIGLHCGNIPQVPPEYCRWTGIRIKHYGYADPARATEKYHWYTALDKDKQTALIGAEDYSHLIAEHMTLVRWNECNELSFAMLMHGEEVAQAREILDLWYYIADEVVIGLERAGEKLQYLARKYAHAKVPIVWEESLAAARNAVVDKCTKQWIMVMDGDEAWHEHDPINVRKMIESGCDGYMFQFRNLMPNGTISISEAVRLWRNRPDVRYTGRVHESLDDAIQHLKLKITMSPIMMDHYGYLKPDKRMDEKLELYERLNMLQLQDNPGDARPYFNLALHYSNNGDVDRAAMLLQKAVQLNPKYYQALKELGHYYLTKCLTLWSEAAKYVSDQHQGKQQLVQMIDYVQKVNIVAPPVGGYAKKLAAERASKQMLKPSLAVQVATSNTEALK